MGTRANRGSVGIKAEALTFRPLGSWTKRALDLILALALLVLLAPLMLTVALLIRATSPGGVIFSQPRIGLKGCSFPCFKFRTMVPKAEEELRLYFENNPEAAREWGERHKLRYNPRITWVGHLSRKSSIDELPQMINAPRGDDEPDWPGPIVASELDRYGEFGVGYLGRCRGLQACGR